MTVKPTLIKTKDGSHSLYLPEMDEHYHSIHGAITESQHVFITAGLKAKTQDQDQVRVLEVGFGTGLNACLTAIELIHSDCVVEYLGIEAFPLEKEIYFKLNYGEQLGTLFKQFFRTIHEGEWEQLLSVHPKFMLKKTANTIQEIQLDAYYDVIYFDAFAPEKQEEMWGEAVFQKLFDCLYEGGILVTYCVKGVIRRRLQSIGFKIEKLPGPVGGKREMLRARKI